MSKSYSITTEINLPALLQMLCWETEVGTYYAARTFLGNPVGPLLSKVVSK